MNKPKQQGTAWETEVARTFQQHDIPAGRYPEGGTNDLGDVWVGQPMLPGDPPPTVLVAWKRLVPGPGSRRIPDGDKTVIIMDFADFIEILCTQTSDPNFQLAVECKATQTLNVTRTLNHARKKIYGALQ